MRDIRGEEEVDEYGAHVLFLCDQKGGGGEKKSTRFKEYAYEKNGSPSKKKQSKNLKKEPFVGYSWGNLRAHKNDTHTKDIIT